MKNVGIIEGVVLFPTELKEGKNGSKYCHFKIRHQTTYNDKPIYNDFDITCFGTNAEIASLSCRVGATVEVDYHLQKANVNGKDYTNLIADELRFKDGNR